MRLLFLSLYFTFLHDQQGNRNKDEDHANGWHQGKCFSQDENAQHHGSNGFHGSKDSGLRAAYQADGLRCTP